MKDYLRLYDTVQLQPLKATAQNRLYFKDAEGEGAPYLLVRIAASHAGRLTANNAFYPPQRMQAAVPTWTAPYPKPVLLNHDLEGDPLGRVQAARYVDTSAGLLQKYRQLKDCLKIQASQKSIFKIPDVLHEELMDPHFEGLGYCELLAKITNKDAIERILDGRYHTVSVSFVTDQAVCSICKADWIKDGKCDHSPGQMVDDKPCFIITGSMRFDENSFVNRPADNLAGILEFHVAGVTDRVEVPTRSIYQVVCDAFVANQETLINVADASGLNLYTYRPNLEEVLQLMKVNNSAPVADTDVQEILDQLLPQAQDASLDITSFADQEMVIKIHNYLHSEYDWNVNSEGEAYRVPKDKLALHAKFHKVALDGGFVDSFILGDLDKTLEAEGVPMPEGEKQDREPVEDPKTVTDTEDCPDCTGGDPEADATETADQELLELSDIEDEEKCFELIDAELEAMAAELEAENPEEAQAIRDAKLTTEQRKKLKGSTFCGPNRSFPVPDCAHVTAARRLIGRYKGGSKDKILACVARKAKALGCDGQKDTEDQPTKLTKDELLTQRQALLDQVVALETELKERFDQGFDEPCQECAAKDAEIVQLKEGTIFDADQLDALEVDLQAANDEILMLRDQIRLHLVQTIMDQRQLQNKKPFADEEKQALIDELGQRSLESLSDTVKDQQQSFAQFLDSVAGGMVNEPTDGQITDPTLSVDDNTPAVVDETKALRARVMHQHNVIAKTQGRLAAADYLKAMVKQFPELNISNNQA